jgi:hypothetical protein
MKTHLIAVAVVASFLGCDEKKSSQPPAPKSPAPRVESTPAPRERFWQVWRDTQEQIAEKKQKEQEAREAAEAAAKAEAERRAAQLRTADELVSKSLEQLGETIPGNKGFRRTEGFTAIDPWGRPLQVRYHQEWNHEIVTVRCLGPDGSAGTVDDVVRTKRTLNFPGIGRGIPTFGWIALGLLFALFVCAYHRVTRKHERP